jgi:hypothetical protein
MNKSKEGYFYSHCDDENCDLGSFSYQCPVCNWNVDNYEVWWEEDNLYHGKTVEFKCEKCNANLFVVYNKYKFIVSEKKNN